MEKPMCCGLLPTVMSELGNRSSNPTQAFGSPKPQQRAWLQCRERPQTRTLQLSCPQISISQKLWDNLFQDPKFWGNLLLRIDNWYKYYRNSLALPLYIFMVLNLWSLTPKSSKKIWGGYQKLWSGAHLWLTAVDMTAIHSVSHLINTY